MLPGVQHHKYVRLRDNVRDNDRAKGEGIIVLGRVLGGNFRPATAVPHESVYAVWWKNRGDPNVLLAGMKTCINLFHVFN